MERAVKELPQYWDAAVLTTTSFDTFTRSGIIGDPLQASGDQGEALLKEATEGVVNLVSKVFRT